MKIVLVIDQMVGGGAAKKLTLIANELSRKGHVVTVATNIYKPIVYELGKSVKLISIYSESAYRKSHFSRLYLTAKMLRRLISELCPDIVVSFLPHVSFMTKMALLGKGVPIVFSDETSYARKDSLLGKYLRHHFYKYADAIVVLTENDCRLLGKKFPKIVAIHNPVEQKKPLLVPIFERKKRITVIGQTTRWEIKGLDIAVEAWSAVAKDFPDWKLSVVGEQEPESERYLLGLADESVRDQIEFLGFQQDIMKVMTQTQVFLLTSRFEGFSLSLVEALMAGVPCIAFSEYGVVDEVSLGGKGTIIIPDNEIGKLTAALKDLLIDGSKRESLSKEGVIVAAEYAPEIIVNQWEKLFLSIIKRKKATTRESINSN